MMLLSIVSYLPSEMFRPCWCYPGTHLLMFLNKMYEFLILNFLISRWENGSEFWRMTWIMGNFGYRQIHTGSFFSLSQWFIGIYEKKMTDEKKSWLSKIYILTGKNFGTEKWENVKVYFLGQRWLAVSYNGCLHICHEEAEYSHLIIITKCNLDRSVKLCLD